MTSACRGRWEREAGVAEMGGAFTSKYWGIGYVLEVRYNWYISNCGERCSLCAVCLY